MRPINRAARRKAFGINKSGNRAKHNRKDTLGNIKGKLVQEEAIGYVRG